MIKDGHAFDKMHGYALVAEGAKSSQFRQKYQYDIKEKVYYSFPFSLRELSNNH